MRRCRDVAGDGLAEMADDGVGGCEGLPGMAGLAMDADAHFHLARPERKRRALGLRHRHAVQRHTHRADAGVQPLAKLLQLGQRHAALGRCTQELFDDQCSGDAASASAFADPRRFDVVADDDHVDVVAVAGHLDRHFEIHQIAVIVLDHEQAAGAGIGLFDGGDDLARCRRGEDMADARGIQHALADEADMHRLMAGAAA
ncbi:hypothetical protein ACVI1T_000734 [Rhizobium redzepovicii]